MALYTLGEKKGKTEKKERKKERKKKKKRKEEEKEKGNRSRKRIKNERQIAFCLFVLTVLLLRATLEKEW